MYRTSRHIALPNQTITKSCSNVVWELSSFTCRLLPRPPLSLVFLKLLKTSDHPYLRPSKLPLLHSIILPAIHQEAVRKRPAILSFAARPLRSRRLLSQCHSPEFQTFLLGLELMCSQTLEKLVIIDPASRTNEGRGNARTLFSNSQRRWLK